MARKIFQAISDDTHTYAVIETASGGGGQYRHPVKLSTIKVENDDLNALTSTRILGNAKVDVIESWEVDSRSTGSKSNYAKTLGAMLDELPSHVQGDVLHDTGLVANPLLTKPEADFQSTLDRIVNATSPSASKFESNKDADKDMWSAIHYGNTNWFLKALKDGADINGRHGVEITSALHEVVKNGYTDMVQIAIEHGADLDTQDTWGCTPLHHAAAKFDPPIADLLLAAGANPLIVSMAGNLPSDEVEEIEYTQNFNQQLLDAEARWIAEAKREALTEIADQHRPTATLTKHAAQQACERADHDGSTEISAGVYLNSRESIQEEQAQWNDGDGAKHVDFSQTPYWLTTDDGQEPVAITGADDQELLDTVSVDERVASYAQERAAASTPAALPQRPQEELATAEQVQTKRQTYGRAL